MDVSDSKTLLRIGIAKTVISQPT